MLARTTATVLVALGLALVATGCGDDEGPQIPRDQAAELISSLREANRRVRQDPPVCGDLADDSLPKLEEQAANLPEETDEGVRETVQDGIDHLRSLIEAECAARQDEPEETTTTTTEEEPPPPTTTEEEPPPTTTTPPETTPPETTPPPETPGNGNGNNGGGNGGSGTGGQGVPQGSVAPKLKNDKKGRD